MPSYQQAFEVSGAVVLMQEVSANTLAAASETQILSQQHEVHSVAARELLQAHAHVQGAEEQAKDAA